MKLYRDYLLPATLILSLLIASCGGGGGSASDGTSSSGSGGASASSKSSIISATPADGAAVILDEPFRITLKNMDKEHYTNGKYEITLYSDSLYAEPLEEATGLAEDDDGYVVWEPTITLHPNRVYYWRVQVVYNISWDEQELETLSFAFYTLDHYGVSVVGPRDGGYMDVNLNGSLRFTITNITNVSDIAGADITYDFEVYDDSAMTNLVASGQDIAQSADEQQTTWTSQAELTADKVYYWRVRAEFNGNPLNWSGPYSFTFMNYCGISGPSYATNVISTSTVRECDKIEFTDPTEALGNPNACCEGEPSSYQNFYSMDFGGELVLEMGATVLDGSGNDIRVYEFVSFEHIEVLAGQTETGPWYSLGDEWCGEYCDFDLAAGGVAYTKYIKIKDLWDPTDTCHSTSGADIDAVIWLNPHSSADQCS